ncbi:hypothetical protein HYALB_00008361 [Hymenoscyphus albidus]|uniref:Rhodopsin domain-containing protein n=1 Tax=Hymenoscyphus albidus TaxID=595503 RepID=A0A9N9LLK2_9HELO|nr:hypothetical protein HYALB_00008361 [Hymenoscyphus albidus]
MIFIADNYSKSQMIGLGIAFIILPIVAITLRIWAKLLSRGTIVLDDYLILVALAFAIGCCSMQLVAATKGQLGQHQTVGLDGQPLLDDPKFIIYEKTKFAVNMLSTVGLGFTKSSILVFYMSIFRGKEFVIAVRVMLGIVIVWTVSFFFANLFTCYPITPFVEPFYGHKCLDAISMWYAMSISDLIVDILILAMPIPMVLHLKLRPKQKIGVLAMFLLGATVCAFSVTRMIVYYHVGEGFAAHYTDETYFTSPVFFWANIELSSAIISACLPTYRSLWVTAKKQSQSTRGSLPLKSYPVKTTDTNWGSSGKRSKGLTSDTESQMDLQGESGVNTFINGGRSGSAHSVREDGIAIQQSVEFSSEFNAR